MVVGGPVVVPDKVDFKAPKIGIVVKQGLYCRKWRRLALVAARIILVVEDNLLKVGEAYGGDLPMCEAAIVRERIHCL